MQNPTQVVGRRVVAYIIDLLIVVVISAIAWFALTKNVGTSTCLGGGFEINGKCRGFTSSGNRSVWLVITILAAIGIWAILPGLRGTSPGHAAVGVRIVNREGQVPGIGRGLVRAFFLWLIDVSLVGLIVAIFTQQHQRVGDLVAGTYGVDKNFQGAIDQAQPAPIGAPPPQQQPHQQQSQQPQGGQPANWYPDPHGQARLRYWDGQRWTEHTSA
jgi:uncharacterized RDD family membrane protein YckC